MKLVAKLKYLKKSIVGGNRCQVTQKKPIIDKFLLPAVTHTHVTIVTARDGMGYTRMKELGVLGASARHHYNY